MLGDRSDEIIEIVPKGEQDDADELASETARVDTDFAAVESGQEDLPAVTEDMPVVTTASGREDLSRGVDFEHWQSDGASQGAGMQNIHQQSGGASQGAGTQNIHRQSEPGQNSYQQGQGSSGQNGYQQRDYQPQPVVHKQRGAGNIILIVLAIIFIGIPIGLPVALVVLSLVFAAMCVVAGLIVGFGIAGVACTICGLVLTIAGVVRVFALPFFGACAIGGGLLTFGIGILFILFIVLLAGKVLPAIFRGMLALLSLPFGGRRVKR